MTLSNFFHKSPGEFKFSHNIGKVEIYGKLFSTPFLFVPHPWVALKMFDYSHNYTIFDAVSMVFGPTFYTKYLASSNLATT